MDGLVPGKEVFPAGLSQQANVLPARDAWNLFLGSHPESKVWRDGAIGLKDKGRSSR